MTNVTFPFDTDKLAALTMKWAAVLRQAPLKWQTGVYPAEMAVFLGLCELRGVKTIIESGRGPDAYSTHVLGLYAQATGTQAISVDYSPIENHHYGPQLSQYSALRCEAGDAFKVLPRVCARAQGPIGMLIDGPKGFLANVLSFALSSSFDVAVIAHHNCEEPSPWWKEFSATYTDAFHYEDLPLSATPEWDAFRTWEAEYVGHYETKDEKHALPGRSLSISSLSLASLVPEEKKSILSRVPSFMRRLRIRFLRLRWKFFG